MRIIAKALPILAYPSRACLLFTHTVQRTIFATERQKGVPMAVKATIKNGGMASGILVALVRWSALLLAFAAVGIGLGLWLNS